MTTVPPVIAELSTIAMCGHMCILGDNQLTPPPNHAPDHTINCSCQHSTANW